MKGRLARQGGVLDLDEADYFGNSASSQEGVGWVLTIQRWLCTINAVSFIAFALWEIAILPFAVAHLTRVHLAFHQLTQSHP